MRWAAPGAAGQEPVTLICGSPAVCPWACPPSATSFHFLRGAPGSGAFGKGQGPGSTPERGGPQPRLERLWGRSDGMCPPTSWAARLSPSPLELGVEGGSPKAPSLPTPSPVPPLGPAPSPWHSPRVALVTPPSQAGNSAWSQQKQRLQGQWGGARGQGEDGAAIPPPLPRGQGAERAPSEAP